MPKYKHIKLLASLIRARTRTHLSSAQIYPIYQHRKGFCSQRELAASPISWFWPGKGSFLQAFA